MTKLSKSKVVLASGSPRRHELLRLIGVEHDVKAADVDETHSPGEKPEAYAERLARTKAEAVAQSHAQALVVGADTIVVVDDHILGKPLDVADAARMLRLLNDRTHVVMTAVALSHEARTVSAVEKVLVTFRDLSEDDIARYVATGEPMDKAGAYGIQGYGATIVRRIEGDYFAVMGLSLVSLVELMSKIGVTYDFAR